MDRIRGIDIEIWIMRGVRCRDEPSIVSNPYGELISFLMTNLPFNLPHFTLL